MTEYKVRDKVRLTRGDERVDGEVGTVSPLIVHTGLAIVDVATALGVGWTLELVERPVEIPTERGVYLDRENDVWVHDGYWLLFYPGREDDPYSPENFAPFRRLYTLEEAGDVFWSKLVDTRTYDPYDSFEQEYIRKVLKGEK